MKAIIIQALTRVFSGLSSKGAQKAGRAIAWLLGSVMCFRRVEVLEAIRRSFPEKPPSFAPSVAKGMYAHLGALLVEFLRISAVTPEKLSRDVIFTDFEKIDSILIQGRGLIALTAHIGNFELLAMVSAFKGVPLTIITKKLKPGWLNDWWVETRSRFGLRVLPSRNSFLDCLGVLGNNGVLAFVLDQNMNKYRGIFVDFFGRPACTSPGLAILSARSGAPVLPAFITREGDGRHKVHILDPLPSPRGTGKDMIRAATQQYTTIIEQFIRAHPDQWIWLHRRWRTQPEEHGSC